MNNLLIGIFIGLGIWVIREVIEYLIVKVRINRVITEDEKVCSINATVLYNEKTDEVSWFDNDIKFRKVK